MTAAFVLVGLVVLVVVAAAVGVAREVRDDRPSRPPRSRYVDPAFLPPPDRGMRQ
ncbi:hypothetical protein [Nocardioides sp. TF02-7]|uniref:hypothetical protein n=1 Tax=Nocardioides sp. TF02-7 TaxID=2917724 RepID=UPI001F05D042|nr:hypothetical protein [Nocardioides sp. TF02-7]UMG93112.1 hypothetical protein MF408_01925 [Nocardioides sp. TF02-7]